MQIKTAHLSGRLSYPSVMESAFGSGGYYLLSFLQFLYPFLGETRLRHLTHKLRAFPTQSESQIVLIGLSLSLSFLFFFFFLRPRMAFI